MHPYRWGLDHPRSENQANFKSAYEIGFFSFFFSQLSTAHLVDSRGGFQLCQPWLRWVITALTVVHLHIYTYYFYSSLHTCQSSKSNISLAKCLRIANQHQISPPSQRSMCYGRYATFQVSLPSIAQSAPLPLPEHRWTLLSQMWKQGAYIGRVT